ncbi:MAG: hypothetical protein HYV90_05860 [Candidatus Woesebacteria bacterium]|nr:MAG: hypothetical protein HYV90_05860 [Candidatus Woesebacteria bacterium]
MRLKYKKFSLVRIIGVVFLIAVVAAVVVLVSQPQIFRSKAEGYCHVDVLGFPCMNNGCLGTCVINTDHQGASCFVPPGSCDSSGGGGGGGGGGGCTSTGDCKGGKPDDSCCANNQNGYCAYNNATSDPEDLKCIAFGATGGGGSGGSWASFLSRSPKCSSDGTCAAGFKCSAVYNKCFTNKLCSTLGQLQCK